MGIRDPTGIFSRYFVVGYFVGNVVGAYESYPWTRFGLDASIAWKRIDELLSPREQELHAIARSDVEVLLNGSLLATVVGLAVFVDRVVHPSPAAVSAVAFLALSYVLYRLAASAEGRLGDEKRASFDLHRFELYQGLGLRAPASLVDERTTVAPAVNELLQFGGDVPDELWAGEYPPKR